MSLSQPLRQLATLFGAWIDGAEDTSWLDGIEDIPYFEGFLDPQPIDQAIQDTMFRISSSDEFQGFVDEDGDFMTHWRKIEYCYAHWNDVDFLIQPKPWYWEIVNIYERDQEAW